MLFLLFFWVVRVKFLDNKVDGNFCLGFCRGKISNVVFRFGVYIVFRDIFVFIVVIFVKFLGNVEIYGIIVFRNFFYFCIKFKGYIGLVVNVFFVFF